MCNYVARPWDIIISERQIPYDLTSVWNVKKKKKKKPSKTKLTEDIRAVTTGKGLGWGSETGEGDQEINPPVMK